MSPSVDVACAERIALLHLLHKVPIPRSKNGSSPVSMRHEGYTMPFDRERQFVGACAFLSCIKADQKKIPAVCVQEVPETQSLNLLVAANKRSANDSREYLREMKAGFERVFQELTKVGIGEFHSCRPSWTKRPMLNCSAGKRMEGRCRPVCSMPLYRCVPSGSTNGWA